MARFFSVKVTGMRETQAALKKLGKKAPKALGKALFREGERIIGKAKSPENVPVDTGNLRSSGHVQLPKFTSKAVIVELGFGGPAGTGNQGSTNSKDVGYALVVHEDLRGVVPRPGGVGRAKYLEIPFNEALSAMDQRLASDLKREIKEAS